MKSYLTKFKIYLIAGLGALIFKALIFSLRWRLKIVFETEEGRELFKRPTIILFWHHNLILMTLTGGYFLDFSGTKIHVLTSQHGDGLIIAKLIKHLRVDSIAGSSSNGGKKAMLGLIKVLRKNETVAITPDGPRGPIHELKPGCMKIAQAADAQLVPVGHAARPAWYFASWDRMGIPMPFSRTVTVIGEPILVPRGMSEEDFEKLRLYTQDKLNEVSKKAEDFVK